MTDETESPADEPELNADEDKLVDEIASYLEDRAMKIWMGSHGTKADPVMAGHIMAAGSVVRSRAWKGFKNGA